MEHHEFIDMNDDTAITHSDIKYKPDGDKYITIYFETPTDDGFSDMAIDYPDGRPRDITGYTDKDIERLMYHYDKLGSIAFDDALDMEGEARNA